VAPLIGKGNPKTRKPDATWQDLLRMVVSKKEAHFPTTITTTTTTTTMMMMMMMMMMKFLQKVAVLMKYDFRQC
jgi:hypothetical protein